MAYNVSQDFTNKLYSGESNFRAILTIGENTIDNDQIASISISSPIIDDSKQVFYVGSFISQKITIKFKNMDGIDVHSGDNVDLSIGQYVNNEWVDVPIGKFLVDDLAEDYFEKCEISCLDYAVKFKPNIDYSLCFTDGKATIKEILEYICDYFNVEIGDYPTINDDVEIGTYDSTVSGKQWISYIAELKGCNAKIDRLGRLTLQPLKQSSNVPINALESASFELGEEFNITKVTFFDAIRNYTYGDDEGNTLFIRQDNPFITDTKVVQNIYDNLCAIKYSASGKSFDIEDADAHPINVNTIYGETSQPRYTGKNLVRFINYMSETKNGVTLSVEPDGTITLNGTATAQSDFTKYYAIQTEANKAYTLNIIYISGSSSGNVGIYNQDPDHSWQGWDRVGTIVGNSSVTHTFSYTMNMTTRPIRAFNGVTYNNLKFKLQFTQNASADYNYEPYTNNEQAPSPNSPVDINNVTGGNTLKIEGQNLINYNNVFNIGTKADGITPSITEEGYLKVVTTSGNGNWHTKWWGLQTYDYINSLNDKIHNGDTFTISFTIRKTSGSTGVPKIYIKQGMGYYDMIGNISEEFSEIYYTGTWNSINPVNIHLGWNATVGTFIISNWQIKKGEYQPYIDYEVREKTINLPTENLFNKYGDFTFGNTNYKTSLNEQGQLVSKSNYYSQRSAGLLIEGLASNTYYTLSGTLISANGTGWSNAIIEVRNKNNNTQLFVYQLPKTLTKPYNFKFTFSTLGASGIWLSFNGMNSEAGGETNTVFDNIQLEKGLKANIYTPHCYDENYYQLPASETKNQVILTNNSDTISLNGTATANTGFTSFVDLANINIKNNTRYVLSCSQQLPSGVDIRCELYNNDTWVRHIVGPILSSTSTATNISNLSGGNRIRFSIWVNSGTQVNINNLSIQLNEHIKTLELCELDDYSDYEEDTVNLFDYAKVLLLPVKTGGGATITNNRDGSFTISGSGNITETFGGSYTDLTHEQTVKLLRAGTLKFKCDYATVPRLIVEGYDGSTMLFQMWNRDTNVQTATVTQEMLDNNNFKLRLSFYAYSGLTITPATIHPMLYQDGDGTFEPIKYKKSKDYIKKNTGKNICDITAIMPSMISSIGVQTPFSYDSNTGTLTITNNSNDTYLPAIWNNASYIQGINISVKPNTTYTFSFDVDRPLSELNNSVMALNMETNKYEYLSSGLLHTNIFTVNSGNHTQIAFRIGSTAQTGTVTHFSNFQIEENNTRTSFEPYGNNEWYKCTKIGKYTFTGASNENWYLSGSNTIKCNALDTTLNYPKMKTYYSFSQNHTLGLYSNYGLYSTSVLIYNLSTKRLVGLGARDTGGGTTDAIYVSTDGQTISDFKTKLANNPLVCYYTMETPIYEKIAYQPLIDQLNELQNTKLFEDTNYITVDTLNEKPSLDIDYFKDSHFSLWSLKTHNYGDFTLDAWDNIDYDLDGTHYLTLNNNNIKYEMSIMGDVESKIPTKQQEVTTNIIGGDDNTNIKMIKTTVDHLNGQVDIISGTQTGMQKDISDLQVANNTITSTVENIQKYEIGENDTVGLRHRISQTEQKVDTITDMFQITGGINIIRNSAFLLSDDVWDFTDYGTNPYHTPLGNSYNSSLSGTTISVAEIKTRSMKIKSKSENITNLIVDAEGKTKYTFNFYHKQDADMTTTIKMYSTENNNIKAFDDIIITGQQPFKNYEASFTPTYANYTLEIIVASATSIGYAYLYDMMLNAGDKQSWQPASDEIYSTTLQMSRLGLQVYSVGDGTITLLGSDGLTSWETSDGKTKGRLVSKRTIDGDRVKTITTQSVKLVSDATKTDEELTHEDKWVETTTKVSGKIAKVIYMESGV